MQQHVAFFQRHQPRLPLGGDGAFLCQQRPGAELEDDLSELRIADRLIMPGLALDPWPYYASADLFVLSSDYEGYPMVLIEALLSGVNIVSTDCRSGPREILDGGRFGRLVPVGDAKSLAKAMAEALDRLRRQ